MGLTDEQIASLMKLVASTHSDALDCDDCYAHLAEFADRRLRDQPIPEALAAVENHLDQCACCRDEFETLILALQQLDV